MADLNLLNDLGIFQDIPDRPGTDLPSDFVPPPQNHRYIDPPDPVDNTYDPPTTPVVVVNPPGNYDPPNPSDIHPDWAFGPPGLSQGDYAYGQWLLDQQNNDDDPLPGALPVPIIPVQPVNNPPVKIPRVLPPAANDPFLPVKWSDQWLSKLVGAFRFGFKFLFSLQLLLFTHRLNVDEETQIVRVPIWELPPGAIEEWDFGLITWTPTPVPVTVNAPGAQVEVDFKPAKKGSRARLRFRIRLRPREHPREFELPEIPELLPLKGIELVPPPEPYQFDIPDTSLNLRFELNNGEPEIVVDVRAEPVRRPGKRDSENVRRNDKKTKSQLLYMSALSFINRTWGKVSEVIDFYEVLLQNIRFTRDTQVGSGLYDTILITHGTSLADIPYKYQKIIWKSDATELLEIDCKACLSVWLLKKRETA